MFVGWLNSSYAFMKFMSVFFPSLSRSACLLNFESALGVNNKVVDNFLSFPESLGSPLFDAYRSSYGWNKWLLCCCPESEHVPKVVCFALHCFVSLLVLAHDTTRVKLIYLRYLINVLYDVGQARN